jgi:hypothetical protein
VSDRAEVAIEYMLLGLATAFAESVNMGDLIAMPNIPFTQPTPSPTAKWLRATILPADSFALAIGPSGPNQHYGFLQIDVFHGQNAGELVPLRIAAEATTYFKFGTSATRDGFTVKVLDTPKIRSSVRDDPWIMIPVRIPYKCFANNP